MDRFKFSKFFKLLCKFLMNKNNSKPGGTRCACLISILPAASVIAAVTPDRNLICLDFCRFHMVTLRGCVKCPFERYMISMGRKPAKKNRASTLAPEPDHEQEFDLFDQPETSFVAFENPADASIQASTTDAPVTPDWIRLCSQLCRQGNGGILCNCDLAPF